MPSSLRLLRSVVASLEQAGFTVFVFGGWAEELHGLTRSGDHRDIDLLLLDPDERALAAFLDTREEILAKRSTQKRAFELDGVMVELFIARSENGEPVTYFWNHLRWVWPADLGVSIVGLPVTSAASLARYRSSWLTIQAARQHHRRPLKRQPSGYERSSGKIVAVDPIDPNHVAGYDERLAKVTIGAPRRLSGRIELRDYDPMWPEAYRLEAACVRRALGRRVVRLEHVGSTSVAGLPAKPIIDIVLEVHDSSDEPEYVSDLEMAGYVLRIREPDWFEHRLLKSSHRAVNLHVFSGGCPETDRMVQFRDWLRTNAEDRDLYERCKRELASHEWTYVQQYADAKTEMISSILARARATRGA